MSESRSNTALTVAAVTVATGVLVYAVYFDYKRRNDAQFRKKLRKEKKRVDKTVAQEKSVSGDAGASSLDVTPDMLRDVLEQVRKEEAPKSAEEREGYFMTQVGIGEQLVAQGPTYYLPAAIAFFKALRVYPSPVELIVIYQKTVVEPVFKLIIEMTNLDVAAKALGYYDHFPPKSMNVEIKSGENGRKLLVATKNIAAGETIYKELPVVAVLDADLESSGKYCSHCFRPLQQPIQPSQLPSDANPLGSTYCSEQCLKTSKAHSTSLLFTLDPALPPELAPGESPALNLDARKKAQEKYAEYIKKEGRAAPLLVARFITRQIALETAKLTQRSGQPQQKEDDFTDTDEGGYMLADHMERLRYLEVIPNKDELPLVLQLLETTLPGLEQFITDERHAMLLGKMLYNAIGVTPEEGRDDKPAPTAPPEDVERTRTPAGTQRQIGSALYTLSSYINHSCNPSTKPTFPKGTTELHLVATRDLKKGDEITMAYVDVSRHEGESVVDARRRRRMELARGWRFACPCEKCKEEEKEMNDGEKKAEEKEKGKDESKVEETAQRLEEEQQKAQEKEAGDV